LVGPVKGSEFAPDGFNDGFWLRELPGFQLGVDQLAVHLHFETPTSGRDELYRADTLFEFEEFFRQTDGVRFVVSDRAIFNRDFHSL
jgi:hypothetical protein